MLANSRSRGLHPNDISVFHALQLEETGLFASIWFLEIPVAMLPRPIALVVLIVVAVAECVDVDLSALVVAQGRLLEQMQQQLQSLTAVVEALKPAKQQGREQGEQGEQGAAVLDYFDSGLGRLLTAAPDTQRKTWHHSILHSFDVPTSCGLHAELDSDATGPMDITRLSEGNVTMGYGGAASASQPAAFEMNHPANCRTATLTANHPLMVTSLSLQGTDLTSKLLALAAYTIPKYVRYTNWACAGKNGFMNHPYCYWYIALRAHKSPKPQGFSKALWPLGGSP